MFISWNFHVFLSYYRYERISEYLANKYRTLEELWLDPSFLATLFFYVSPSDRGILAQVCKTWRDVLYQPVFWTGVMPVLRCRELRATSGDLSSTSELRKRVRTVFIKANYFVIIADQTLWIFPIIIIFFQISKKVLNDLICNPPPLFIPVKNMLQLRLYSMFL